MPDLSSILLLLFVLFIGLLIGWRIGTAQQEREFGKRLARLYVWANWEAQTLEKLGEERDYWKELAEARRKEMHRRSVTWSDN